MPDNSMIKKFIFVIAFNFVASLASAQNFSALVDGHDTNMKYQIIEDFVTGREYWEFYENDIKYVFMKTNIYIEPDYIYFEYNMKTKQRLRTIAGMEAVWIQGDRSITCAGINRIFTITPMNGDK